MPRVFVSSPPLVPYRFGASTAIDWQTPLDQHELGGIQWVSQGCSAVEVVFDRCVNPDDASLTAVEDFCQVNGGDPFTVAALFEAGLYPTEGDDLSGRFAGAEQYGLEVYLQTLLDAATTPEALGSAAGLTEAETAATFALAWVEQRIAEVVKAEAVIHLSRFTAGLLSGKLTANGGALRTTLGNVVVAGAGYEPVGDAVPSALTIYATGPIRAVRSLIQANDVVIPETNDRSSLLQRTYALGWDCGAVAASVTLT